MHEATIFGAVTTRTVAGEELECVTMPVLGIPTRFESNAPEVIRIAEEAFAAWRMLEDDPAWITAYPARVRILVREGNEGPDDHAPMDWATRGRGWQVATPGSRGFADPDRRESLAHVTTALVRDRDHFRYGVLEALTLALLTRFDREPLHAAGLVRGDTALLLAGRSGVGKSTLSYAAIRAGLKVLAEDIVFLQRDPVLRVWGMPGYLHPDPEARGYYPELGGTTTTLRANGKTKLALDVRTLGGMAPRPVVDRAGICLLERGEGGPRLAPLSPEEVATALSSDLEEGFDAFEDSIGSRIRLLAQRGGWRLTLGGAPDDALPLLHRMFDAVEREG